jgi:hypothetical protein
MKSRRRPFFTGSVTHRFACRGRTAGQDRRGAPRRAKRFGSLRCCAYATQTGGRAASALAIRQQSIEQQLKGAPVVNLGREEPDACSGACNGPIAVPPPSKERSTIRSGPMAANSEPLPIPAFAVAMGVDL